MSVYVLFAPPGAGKDTLVDQLSYMSGFRSVSTGQIYREQANKGTELGLRARDEYWGKGMICPDDMTNNIMQQYLSEINIKSGETLLINGYPRSVAQAKFLDSIFKIDGLIYLNVSDELAIKRLMIRGRIDDQPNIVQKRLEVYHLHANDIINYYKKSNRIIELDASLKPEEVFHKAFIKIS